jgi:hypothetical protein
MDLNPHIFDTLLDPRPKNNYQPPTKRRLFVAGLCIVVLVGAIMALREAFLALIAWMG